MNKSTIEQTMPSAETGTGLLNTMVNRNQGSGKLQRTKKRERNVIYKGNFQLFLNFPCCSYLDVTFFSKQLVFFSLPFITDVCREFLSSRSAWWTGEASKNQVAVLSAFRGDTPFRWFLLNFFGKFFEIFFGKFFDEFFTNF